MTRLGYVCIYGPGLEPTTFDLETGEAIPGVPVLRLTSEGGELLIVGDE